MTPREALNHLDNILERLRLLRPALSTALDRADLVEAQACLEDLAMRLQEDIEKMDAGLEDSP